MRTSFITAAIGCMVLGWTVGAAEKDASGPAPAPAGQTQVSISAAPPPSPIRMDLPVGFFGGDRREVFDVDAASFPKGSWFRQHFGSYVPRTELQAPVRLGEFVVDGKIELSLKNYIDLVLVNNTDIQITKLQVETVKNQIQRAFSVFDPTLQTRFAATRTNQQTTDALAGAATLKQLTQPWNATYQQTLATGTQFSLGLNGQKLSTNNTFALFNPSYTSNLNFNFTQPLLRNRGGAITRLPITIARSRLKQSQFNLQDQLIRLLAQAENVYWNVVEARENLRVQEQALTLADEALKRAKRELELGATSPLEIFQPEAQFANAKIFVTQARFRLAQTEDALRRQIGVDLDPSLRDLPIVLTESVAPPTSAAEMDREEVVAKALRRRPDLRAAVQSLDIDDLNIKGAGNALLPNLALGAGYTSTGRGGPFYQRQNVFGQSQLVSVIPGGITDAFDQLFGFNFPIYNFSLTLTLPLRDRRASADLADAMIARKRDMLNVRNTEQAVRLEVLNALNQIENSKASVALATNARDLAQKRVDAEQKKYELGTTTIFFVLAAQTDLTQAESQLVTQSISYRRNLVQLLQRTGELLEERGVVVQ